MAEDVLSPYLSPGWKKRVKSKLTFPPSDPACFVEFFSKFHPSGFTSISLAIVYWHTQLWRRGWQKAVSWFPFCCHKPLTKSNKGKERVCFPLHFQVRAIIEGSQGRNSRHDPKGRLAGPCDITHSPASYYEHEPQRSLLALTG